MQKFFTLILLVSFFLVGCGEKPENKALDEISYGTIVDGVYSNEYFDMSIKVPENWIVQNQASQKELMEVGSNLIAGDDANLKVIMKEAEKQTVNMFSFFKFEQGAPVGFNPSVISVAERVTNMPGIKKGSDYLFHVKKLLESGQMNHKFPEEIYSVELSGKPFDVMTMQLDVNGFIVNQKYYAARINDYVLSLIISYSSEAEMDELKEALNQVVFSE